MKRSFSAVLLFVGVTVVMLLLAEWTVRWLYAEETVLYPRYHTDVKYGDYTLRRIRPDSRFRHTSVDGSWLFETNSQGFRNTEDFEYAKPPGTLRVLSLGDSHTQGYEVRQAYTFSAVLERYLERHLGPSQVINAGVSGFSTAEALVLLENEGLKYQPDAVVLGFSGNDFEDNIKAALFELDPTGELLINRRSHIPGVRIQNFIYALPGVKWLSENSYFYSILFNTTWELFKQRLSRQATEAVVEYAVPQKEEFSNYEVQLTAALLQRLYRICRERGIELIVVDIPVNVIDGELVSAFPDDLRELVLQNSDAFIDSNNLFGAFVGAAELHVPHGHRHISEFSHTLIGVAVGELLVPPDQAALPETVLR